MYKEEPREFLHGGGDTTFHYRKTTASITAGIGYRFKSGIDVAINYNHGLVPLNKQDFNGKKGYERVFQITAGYDLSKLFKAGKNK
jgi:predicted porin